MTETRNSNQTEETGKMGVEGGGSIVASAVIVLGTEDRLSASVGQECGKLSAALVQLKGECMKFLGDYLIRKNTPLEEPDEVLEESLSDDDDDGELLRDVAGKEGDKSKASRRFGQRKQL